MLLRLIPEPPLPTILFTLSFGNLPDGVPFPAAWTAQLQHILHDELEMPQCIHALDKAAWATCLLHEVTFSVAARSVSVLFVDGTRSEWPLVDEALGKALKEVMDDVNESSVAGEMEERRARAIQAAAQAQAAQARIPPAPSPSHAKGKHKKSRSLLMTLVASFCPSSHPASRSPALPPLPLAPPPPLAPFELTPPPPEPPQSSRYLRRKARAGLVDIYRRYILPALAHESRLSLTKNGAEGGRYVLWNLQSILRRIEVRMHQLGAELGSSPSSSPTNSNSSKRHRISPSVLSESPLSEDDVENAEDTSSASGTTEDSSESADTDASSVSVHTPRDTLPAYPVMCAAPVQGEDARVEEEGGIVGPAARLASSSSNQKSRPRAEHGTKRQSHSQSQPRHLQQQQHSSMHTNSPQHKAQQHEYALLHASTIRLRALIARTSALAHAQTAERHAALLLLERKSRRRAWGSRQLMGGASVDTGMMEGLGVPLKASDLRWCWTVGGKSAVESTRTRKRLLGVGVGIPRMPGGRLAARREIETSMHLELPTPAYRVPSQAGCVPFPQTESGDGDDFCSTGPQDTSPLFGSADGEESDVDADTDAGADFLTHGKKGLAAYSSDDLPALFASSPSHSSSASPDFEAPASAFEDTQIVEAELEGLGVGLDRPFHTFEAGDAFDPPCDAFASALCFEDVSDFKLNFNEETNEMKPRTHTRRKAALI